MRRYASFLLVILVAGYLVTTGWEGLSALVVAAVLSSICLIIIRWSGLETDFLVDVFLVALIARMAFGLLIHIYELRDFFGGDAFTFDVYGQQIVDVWRGFESPDDSLSIRAMSTNTPGWGLHYLTAIIYLIFGPKLLAAQALMCVIGAATAPLTYLCAYQMFQNTRVARASALLVALFPAFVVWSSQLLKDGIIIFLLVLAMSTVLSLQRRFSYLAAGILVVSLYGIISFRFYIFYMVAVAVIGSFVIGRKGSVESIARGFALVAGLGVALTYVGVTETASENLEKFGSLEAVQRSRSDLAKSAQSGFAEDSDVSTAQGAISAIPTGFTYLMFAPFPWSAASLRQAITVPETIIWWGMIPLLISGLLFTIKNKLRTALPILVFSLMLTLGYSIFQGNVGTAYRQRTQIQVFLFIFIGVGYTLLKEKRENIQIERRARNRRVEERLRRLEA